MAVVVSLVRRVSRGSRRTCARAQQFSSILRFPTHLSLLTSLAHFELSDFRLRLSASLPSGLTHLNMGEPAVEPSVSELVLSGLPALAAFEVHGPGRTPWVLQGPLLTSMRVLLLRSSGGDDGAPWPRLLSCSGLTRLDIGYWKQPPAGGGSLPALRELHVSGDGMLRGPWVSSLTALTKLTLNRTTYEGRAAVEPCAACRRGRGACGRPGLMCLRTARRWRGPVVSC